VRIADLKFVKTKLVETHAEALHILFDKFINPWFIYEMELKWGSLNWRANTLFAEDVHIILSLNMPILRELHKKYSCRTDRRVAYGR
jgi:hypothetical protein